MTRDDILRWAQEEGVELPVADLLVPYFERFAALVAAHEREECAKLVERLDGENGKYLGITILQRGE